MVPVHLRMHWCVAVIDFRDKTIRYYDSMGHLNNVCLNVSISNCIEQNSESVLLCLLQCQAPDA